MVVITSNTKLNHIKDRLITYEDPYHIHKTLGGLCLVNFLFRYAVCLPRFGSLGYEHVTMFNTTTIMCHMLLSSSSLIFKVLRHRLPKNPLLLYEEYRLHTILFTLRGCGPYFYDAYASARGSDRLDMVVANSPYLPFICIMGIILCVDWVSSVHGTPGMTTIRVSNKSTRLSTILIRRTFSLYQIIAGASVFMTDMGGAGNMSNMSYNTLIAIQSSAFLMTLVRKNIISVYTHLLIYGICLAISTGYIFLSFDITLLYSSVLIFIGRMCGISKYILWNGFHGYFHGYFHGFPLLGNLEMFQNILGDDVGL